MGKRRCESIERKEEVPSVPEERSEEDLLERIRRLEEEKKRLEREKEDLEKEKDRLEEENRIFRRYLDSHGMTAEEFLERHMDLVRRVNMNSSNSSMPPSSDGYRKPSPKSLRVRTGRKRGGQPGHRGRNIIIPHEPDVLVDHYPEGCQTCPDFGRCKGCGRFECGERRNVLDLEIRVVVTEHRLLRAACPRRSGKVSGEFPDGVKAYAQYGDSFAVAAGVLDTFGYISDKRSADILGAATGMSVSPATIVSLTSRCAEKVAPALRDIRRRLRSERVTHHDETGVRVDGKLHWVHSTSTPECTIQTIQEKRGLEGMDLHGAAPKPGGISVHDCWAPYFQYEGGHAICCAHLLRELTAVEENAPDHRWPALFKEHLLLMKSLADAVRARGRAGVSESSLKYCSGRYDEIMFIAVGECPAPPNNHPGVQGRRKLGKERSLIERLIALKDSVCLFLHDLEVPFDNNQAERDVRYVKVKAKVSGGFRSLEKAQEFLDVRSYLGTAAKNGIGSVDALRRAFAGDPASVARFRAVRSHDSPLGFALGVLNSYLSTRKREYSKGQNLTRPRTSTVILSMGHVSVSSQDPKPSILCRQSSREVNQQMVKIF